VKRFRTTRALLRIAPTAAIGVVFLAACSTSAGQASVAAAGGETAVGRATATATAPTPGSNTPTLGSDPQGETRITLIARTLDGSDPSPAQMQQARTIMENRINGTGMVGTEVRIDGNRTLVITVPGTDEDLNGLTDSAQLNIRPVLTDSGGTPIVSYPADYVPPATSGTPSPTTSDTRATGATSPAPAWPAGSDPANPTQPAGIDTTAWTAWETAAATALPTLGCADLGPYRGLDDPNKPLITCSNDDSAIYLLDKTLIAGTQIDTATSGKSSQGAGWVINMSFKPEGYSTWSSYTTSHTGTLTAMTLDGQVISAPRISGPITTPTTEISGAFTQASAAALANSLKFGALPLAFDRVEAVNVTRTVTVTMPS
jgi:preprotein translocase subunit SecD